VISPRTVSSPRRGEEGPATLSALREAIGREVRATSLAVRATTLISRMDLRCAPVCGALFSPDGAKKRALDQLP